MYVCIVLSPFSMFNQHFFLETAFFLTHAQVFFNTDLAKRISISFLKSFYNSLSEKSCCLFIIGFGMHFILHPLTT